MQSDPQWVNITDIFKRQMRERDLISDNFRAVENIPEIEFVEQSIPIKASLKEAIDIFYIVNASGVNLTEAELALAQISGYWPQARETFKKKLEQLKESIKPFSSYGWESRIYIFLFSFLLINIISTQYI